jgi:hypothetical protein
MLHMERVSTVVRLQPRSRRDRARVRTDWLAPTLLALAVIAALAAIVYGVSSERRAIRSLPGEQRLAVLSSTVDELRQFCGEGRPAALRDHCRELASFAAKFDECRGECEALVRRQLATAPTR